MKISEIKGDLFKTECVAILHGCNAQGKMGSGVAKIVRDRFPQAYTQYTKQAKTGLIMGSCQYVRCDDKMIINAITQEFYGYDGRRYASYDAISEAFRDVNHELPRMGITEVAMPMIGAGLGGGSWSVISAIIESELSDVQPYVYIL
jgi:O-acetyl-ADP-ribose deacetylase (regulator of RNase III)